MEDWMSRTVPIRAIVFSVLLAALCGTARGDAAASPAPELLSGTFPFADIEVFYQMYLHPSKDAPVVLFLHGMAYTSQNWVDLGTLRKVLDAGWSVCAIDLPGYGKTRHLPYVDDNMRAELVKTTLLFARGRSQLTSVLVSPSMSGKWAVPFLDRYGLLLAGWAALAPAGVKSWNGPWEYTHKQVLMWAMYGERDPMKEDADALVSYFANARKLIIPGADHAFYMDKTDEFHDRLLEMLSVAMGLIRSMAHDTL